MMVCTRVAPSVMHLSTDLKTLGSTLAAGRHLKNFVISFFLKTVLKDAFNAINRQLNV